MKFNYQARTRSGELKIGQIEASSYEAALDILQKYGYYVTFLEEFKKKSILEREIRLFRKITRKDLVIFTRQLAILLISQVPPVEALHTLALQTSNPNFKEIILKIASDIEGGKSFSRALSLHPKYFSSFYINMVKSGEMSGTLPQALNNLANHMEREYDLLGKIKSASLYPAFVLFVMAIMFIFVLFFIFPRLREVFLEAGRQLPQITLFMLNFADFLKKWGLILFFALLGGIIFFIKYIKTPEGKRIFDQTLLKIPFLNKILQKIYISRFAENLATLIGGGLPIAQALQTAGDVVGNTLYQEVIYEARDNVRKGESISSTFKKYPKIIPPLVSQMIFIGERTGQLDKSLLKLNNFYKKEVDLAIDKFISLLEPALIIILGLAVATFVLTILLPIYQLEMFY